MKLFIKILLFVLVALIANVKVMSAAITFSNIREVTTSFSFQNEAPKTSFKVNENDFGNSCKNECDLVDYRNWGGEVGVDAAKEGTDDYWRRDEAC